MLRDICSPNTTSLSRETPLPASIRKNLDSVKVRSPPLAGVRMLGCGVRPYARVWELR